jgi:hypothetical protein
MSVLAIFTGKGITKAMYEALRKEVNWENRLAPGGMIHASGFDKAGNLHVADVWASGEAMDEFVQSRLMPAMKKLGVPPPTVEAFPLHNLDVYPAATQHLLKAGGG